MADCGSCWCLSLVEFPLKLSLLSHKTTGLIKCFDGKYMLFHAACYLQQFVLFTQLWTLAFQHPLVLSFTFSNSLSISGVHSKLLGVFSEYPVFVYEIENRLWFATICA
jgi:hypothetical protein